MRMIPINFIDTAPSDETCGEMCLFVPTLHKWKNSLVQILQLERHRLHALAIALGYADLCKFLKNIDKLLLIAFCKKYFLREEFV